MDVGIRDLKARLSEFVEKAARGTVIRVTERGKPKAILAPLPGHVDLGVGIEEGWIQPPKPDAPIRSRRRHQSAVASDRVLRDDRGE
jgi:prevent-host-death family protein